FSHASAAIMRGAGKSIVPMVVMLAFWCVVRVTYITIITRYIPNISVVFWAYPLTWGLSSITFMIYLLSGKWLVAKKKLV
ncbi:MAG: MATE family efflux transporter, partial [Lachnospiraceae bacterium]|nr:MATE family efflux transporter [Lachnospiraceae bacterium]